MTGILSRADSVLRGSTSRDLAEAARPRVLLGIILAFGCLYGALMGTFGGVTGERGLQVVYSALKVPVLLLVTMGLSLPSFFVLLTLFGLRADFAEALRAILAGQAGLTVILASFAPFTLLWYASSADYQAAILFNGVMFAGAAFAGQVVLRGYYRPLLARDAKHRWLLRLWLVQYAFVGIQMGWVLRPFIGSPSGPTTFFRQESWGNAYVMLARLIHDVVAR